MVHFKLVALLLLLSATALYAQKASTTSNQTKPGQRQNGTTQQDGEDDGAQELMLNIVDILRDNSTVILFQQADSIINNFDKTAFIAARMSNVTDEDESDSDSPSLKVRSMRRRRSVDSEAANDEAANDEASEEAAAAQVSDSSDIADQLVDRLVRFQDEMQSTMDDESENASASDEGAYDERNSTEDASKPSSIVSSETIFNSTSHPAEQLATSNDEKPNSENSTESSQQDDAITEESASRLGKSSDELPVDVKKSKHPKKAPSEPKHHPHHPKAVKPPHHEEEERNQPGSGVSVDNTAEQDESAASTKAELASNAQEDNKTEGSDEQQADDSEEKTTDKKEIYASSSGGKTRAQRLTDALEEALELDASEGTEDQEDAEVKND